MVAAVATVAVATAVLGWHPISGTARVANPVAFVPIQPRILVHVRDRTETSHELNSWRSSFGGFGVGGVSRHPEPLQSGVALAQAAKEMAPTVAVTKEGVTGVEFSNSLQLPDGKGELVLVGAGVREKQVAFFKAKVYAVGFYLDASSIGGDALLGAWKGKSERELSNNGDFFKASAEASVEKALKIVLVRDVSGDQFWGALDESLTPRLKDAAAGPAGQEDMNALGQMFKARSFQKGTSVLIFWAQPATLRIDLLSPAESSEAHKATAEPAFSKESPALLPSLFDIYLGNDSVSPSLKSSIASTFPTV